MNIVTSHPKLVDMDKRVMLYNDPIQGQQLQKINLEKEYRSRTKRDNYNGMFFFEKNTNSYNYGFDVFHEKNK